MWSDLHGGEEYVASSAPRARARGKRAPPPAAGRESEQDKGKGTVYAGCGSCGFGDELFHSSLQHPHVEPGKGLCYAHARSPVHLSWLARGMVARLTALTGPNTDTARLSSVHPCMSPHSRASGAGQHE